MKISGQTGIKAKLPVEPGARQLEAGVYISPIFHESPPANVFDYAGVKPESYRDCKVTAVAGFWEGLKKAWVPRYFEAPQDSGLELTIDPRKKDCGLPPELWNMFPFVKGRFLGNQWLLVQSRSLTLIKTKVSAAFEQFLRSGRHRALLQGPRS